MTPSRKRFTPWEPSPTSCRASSFRMAISRFSWKAWSARGRFRSPRKKASSAPRFACWGRASSHRQVDQTVQKITGLYEQFIKLSQSLNYDTMIAAARVDDPARLSDTIAANLQLPVDEKQGLLETTDPLERLTRICDILEIELEKLNVDRNINTRVKRQMERAQKEYYLNEKLKAIQKELGRGEK